MPTYRNYLILIKDTDKIENHIALQSSNKDRYNKKWKSVLRYLKRICYFYKNTTSLCKIQT